MDYLVDTQIIIWFQLFDQRLRPSIYELLSDGRNTLFVSQISLFEIAIKQKIGKLPELDKPMVELIEIIQNDGFEILSLKNRHITSYNSIPLNETHKDPFDRLIIATAIAENLPVISADEKFQLYKHMITDYTN
ncbi:MAG: type II toxin-antitoxin system VapC family toxin [Spirosomataceae bacterium]